ncbi:MAG: Holliday junction branch migration protein RuvA [Coriobacteriia bacterium]|nr:Holliday junction branch migration protein RuvA [Coriobacteriia bacterium]
MIKSVRGTLIERDMSSCVIEVAGIGYGLGITQNTAALLGELGQEIMLYTYMQIREDAQLLYGFISKEERAVFEKLIAINGIGPKVALSILSTYKPVELVQIVRAEDGKRMSKVPGVGPKTASRIILELKSVFDKDPSFSNLESVAGEHEVFAQDTSSAFDEGKDALLSMGFTEEEAILALKGLPDDASLEAAITYALKRLGSM